MMTEHPLVSSFPLDPVGLGACVVVVVAGVTGGGVTGAGVTGAGVVVAGVTGAGVVVAGVTGAGVVVAGVTGGGVVVAAVTGAGVVGAGVVVDDGFDSVVALGLGFVVVVVVVVVVLGLRLVVLIFSLHFLHLTLVVATKNVQPLLKLQPACASICDIPLSSKSSCSSQSSLLRVEP